jgi:hypothetical protein
VSIERGKNSYIYFLRNKFTRRPLWLFLFSRLSKGIEENVMPFDKADFFKKKAFWDNTNIYMLVLSDPYT